MIFTASNGGRQSPLLGRHMAYYLCASSRRKRLPKGVLSSPCMGRPPYPLTALQLSSWQIWRGCRESNPNILPKRFGKRPTFGRHPQIITCQKASSKKLLYNLDDPDRGKCFGLFIAPISIIHRNFHPYDSYSGGPKQIAI